MIYVQNLDFKKIKKNILHLHHILLKQLVDHELILSDNQCILFDSKSFLAAPEHILNMSIF